MESINSKQTAFKIWQMFKDEFSMKKKDIDIKTKKGKEELIKMYDQLNTFAIPEEFQLQVIPYSVKGVPHVFDVINGYVRERFDRYPPELRNPLVITGTAGLNELHGYIVDNYPDGKEYTFAGTTIIHVPTMTKMEIVHCNQFDSTRLYGMKFPGTYYPITSYIYDVYVAGFNVFRFKPNITTEDE